MSKAIILVVDDSDTFLRSVEEILRVENYDVLIASDLQSALEVYQQQSPDLVLTDINLSAHDFQDKSGLALINKIQQCASNGESPTPVVMMSSDPSIEDIIDGYPSGTISFLAKPFDPEVLLNIIAEFCP